MNWFEKFLHFAFCFDYVEVGVGCIVSTRRVYWKNCFAYLKHDNGELLSVEEFKMLKPLTPKIKKYMED